MAIHMKRLDLDTYLSPCVKLKSEWIQELDVKHLVELWKILLVDDTLEDIGTGNSLNRNPVAQKIVEIVPTIKKNGVMPN